MERIGVLINKLQELYQQNAPSEQLIHAVQMLQTELSLLKQKQHAPERKKIAVMMPGGLSVAAAEKASGSIPNHMLNESKELNAGSDKNTRSEEDRVIVALPEKNGSTHEETIASPVFNVLEEVPTLAHQPQVKELNEVMGKAEPSINEKLFERRTELAEKLKDEPLKDIKKAVGVNDRFIFISELFRGDEDMYERSLKTINRFTIYPEAEFWIQRELKLKLGWNEEHPAVKQFDQLVKRRFL